MNVAFDGEMQRRLYFQIQQLPSEYAKDVAQEIVREVCLYGRSEILDRLKAPQGYERPPVSMHEFLEDPYYMGSVENLRETVKNDLIALFDQGEYVEGVIDGAIGWGKSVFVSFVFARMLYQLACMENPQRYYGVIPGSTIYFVNQSVNKTLAQKVIFTEIKARIMSSPFFEKEFAPDPHYTSELRFPKNIIILPVASSDTSAIGLNVFGGVLDEVNFMPIVQRSIKSRGINEVYDTPARLFNAISRRLRSRFMQAGGKVAGKILVVSSSQYPDDFTERKKLEAKVDPRIFVRSHALWESKTEGLCGETFKVEVGGEHGRSRILTGEEESDIRGEVIEVPVEYRSDFEKDIDAAIRDIAGKATLSVDPFMPDVDRIREAFTHEPRQHPFSSIESTLEDGVRLLPRHLADYDTEQQAWKPRYFPFAPRFVHIDYALTNDECGVAMGCVGRMVRVRRRSLETGEEYEELAPFIHIDYMLRVLPPKGGEIDLEKVRSVLVHDMGKIGFRIRRVTFDQFQSSEARQQLRKRGIKSDLLSVDIDMGPYLELKSAHNERRISMYEYQPYIEEAVRLQIDRQRRKVDHPPGWDKGVTDGVAGVVAQCVEETRGAADESFAVIHKGKTEEELRPADIDKEMFSNEVSESLVSKLVAACLEGATIDWHALKPGERQSLERQLQLIMRELRVRGDRERANFIREQLSHA